MMSKAHWSLSNTAAYSEHTETKAYPVLLRALCLVISLAFWGQASAQDASDPVAASTQNIVQSPNDTRQYQFLELPNQLRVLLVSDPTTDKAAAALDVEVGSGDDPKDRAGLAHFLEHMLFLGTERYPEAGEYQTFISEHGGSHNAYTSQEHTNYFFDINADHLDQALDRFSQFFTAPLFTAEYVDRERKAVHSEYKAKIKNDFRRQYDVLRQLISTWHPSSKFSVGNLDTLADRPGAPVREALLDFYQRYYTADRMTLVVLGRESLAELQAMVVDRFGLVERRDAAELSKGQDLFSRDFLPARVYIEPEKDIRTLTLMFPIPSSTRYYRQKPLQYLGNLLGHEGEGSILSVLKAQGWAEGLSAGGGLGGRNQGTFNISIQLTEDGLKQHHKVVAVVYKMIRILKREGINEWRYKEQQQLGNIDFRFAEKGEPIHTVSSLASSLQRYAPEDVLQGGYLFADYDERLISRYLNYLRPDNAVWVVTAKSVETNRISPMYQTPYRVEGLRDERVSLPKQMTEQLALPDPNGFIPRHLVVKRPPAMGQGISQIPQLIKDDDVQKVWFKQDNTYKIPRSQIYVRLKSPQMGRDIKQAVLSELYVAMVKDALNEFSYPASLAGLRFSLSSNSRGLDMYISGYNDRQGLLLSRISEALGDTRFDRGRFKNIKDELLRDMQNSSKQSPYMQSLGDLPVVLYSPLWTDTEKQKVLQSVTLAEVKAFAATFYDDVEQQILMHGNLYRQEALKLAAVIKSRLYRKGDELKAVEAGVVKLVGNEDTIPHWHLTVDHPDSMVGLYLQGGTTTAQDKAHMLVVRQLLRSPFFHELRTQKQLGYIVFATGMPIKKVAGSVLVVQSPTASVADLQQEISGFLANQVFDEKSLAQNKQAVISNLLEAPKNLVEQSEHYWSNIIHEVSSFDRKERLAKQVEAVTLLSLQDYFTSMVGTRSRQMWLTASSQSAEEVSATVEDIQTFKTSKPHYPFP
ncbi:insulinase family protein [Maricurvus nonylphenolicus]|uniref:insulinase family protein n=1 Tax=Maricurvus nonylphenolicus TaxID=1008307 RepID=UPI0036F26611